MRIKNNNSQFTVNIGSDRIWVHGKVPSGHIGIWAFDRYTRVFRLEPFITRRLLTAKEIIKIIKDL